MTRGTYRVDRDPVEPIRKSTLLSAIPIPDDLTDEEKAQYGDICQVLLDRCELTATSAREVSILCKLMTRRDELLSQIGASGFIQTFASGAKQVSPEVSVLEKIDRMITTKMKLLCLDSQGGQRLEKHLHDLDEVDPRKHKSEIDGLLAQINAL